MFNRLVLFLSLLGMVLALHLWVQKERNFDQGCWGVGQAGAVAPASPQGCTNSELQKASELFGVSVAAWGYAFYFFVGVMALGKVLLPPLAARRCHSASEVAVALAFPFSCYLIYVQAFVAHAWCPLCLVSSGLTAALFAIHGYQFAKGGHEPIPEAARPVEIGYAAGMGFVAMGALAALMIMVNQVGTRRFDQGENAKQFTAMVGRSLPTFIEPSRLLEMKPALVNREMAPLRQEEWLAADTPVTGQREGVSVVAFLDPNCPSCAGDFTRLVALAKQSKERVGLYVFSRVLWDHSLLQSQALELARQEGKYFEMWALQFERRKQGGLKLADIEGLFGELGLSTAGLEERLAAVRPTVVAVRDRAKAAGINGTPTIFIEGAAVDNTSRDERSLTKLIEQAAAFRQQRKSEAQPGKLADASRMK